MRRTRKAKGRPVTGWLILNKPVDMGSTEAVSKLKWLFGAQKAGHAGTLDPLASGMLPIAFGEATKTVPYVMDGQKSYRFTVAWGKETTTDDLEGEIAATSATRPSRAQIDAILPQFTGDIAQVPPQFSAVKINGERAYDIAREGERVEIPARDVRINRFEVVGGTDDESEFEVDCGKGTYVRALARDMGRLLGCYGHISGLRRTAVAPFEEARMIDLDILLANEPLEPVERFAALDRHLIGPAEALDALPRLLVSTDQASRLRRGNAIIPRGADVPVNADEAYASAGGELVAIGAIENGQFMPRRVFSAGFSAK